MQMRQRGKNKYTDNADQKVILRGKITEFDP